MTPAFQTLLALGLVALAALFLLRSFLRKRQQPGCGNDCGAVSPEVKKLQSRLKR
jgi:hypothetical protein